MSELLGIKMHFLVTFCFLMLGFSVVNCEDVQAVLKPYSYTGTNCSSGLMVNLPLYLEGIVRLPGQISDTESHFSIEWRGLQAKFREFFTILKPSLCGNSEIFFCKPLQDKLGYSVYLHTQSKEHFSQSEWRLKVTYKETAYFSNTIIIPKIHRKSDISMRVNEQEWFPENTSLTVKSEMLKICCHDAPSPCEAFVSISSKPMVTDFPCVTHVIEIPLGVEYADVKFGFRVCSDDSFSKTYSLSVKMEPQSVSGDISWNTTNTVLCVAIAILLLAFFAFLFFYYNKDSKGKKMKGKQRRPTNKEDKITKPLLFGNNKIEENTAYVNMEPQSSEVEKSRNKGNGKKNEGAKPSRNTATDKPGVSVTRKRSNSESENNTVRNRNAKSKAQRKRNTR